MEERLLQTRERIVRLQQDINEIHKTITSDYKIKYREWRNLARNTNISESDREREKETKENEVQELRDLLKTLKGEEETTTTLNQIEEEVEIEAQQRGE